jgi:putative membrane protein
MLLGDRGAKGRNLLREAGGAVPAHARAQAKETIMRMHPIRFVLAATLAPFLFVGGANAADQMADVLNKLHHSNLKEIHMGQEARQKGQAQAVKEYGATLERDHTAADEKVAALARKKNIELTDPPAGHAQHTLATGPTFDTQFAKMMVEDHKKTIESVKAEREKATDAELKELLGDLLPTLEKHLQTAEALVDGKQPDAGTGSAR